MPRPLIEGYEAEIYRGLWERPQTMGTPRLWGACWIVFCLALGLCALMSWGLWWIIPIALLWLLGQGVLVALSLWEPDWDLILQERMTRQYADYYEAG